MVLLGAIDECEPIGVAQSFDSCNEIRQVETTGVSERRGAGFGAEDRRKRLDVRRRQTPRVGEQFERKLVEPPAELDFYARKLREAIESLESGIDRPTNGGVFGHTRANEGVVGLRREVEADEATAHDWAAAWNRSA